MIRRSAEDVAAWAAFATQVELAIRNPTKSMVGLERAVARAHRAVLPCEPYSPANPWVTVLREARSFAGQLAVSRVDLAGDLEHSLQAAQAHCRLATETSGGGPDAPDPEPANPGRSRWWDRD